jgi:8-oxo-dGTP pyrophosphatase MutT (NUDIX family)
MPAEDLVTFLQRYAACDETTTAWRDLHFHVTSYLSPEIPPVEMVSSVRCVLLRPGAAGGAREVMVVRDQNGAHLLPGGRREPDEALIETAQREVLEETGWTVVDMRLLGFVHYRHLTPRPDGYKYPYPDFFHVVFAGRADIFRPESRFAAEILEKEHVLSTEFVPVDTVGAFPLAAAHLLFLDAAMAGHVSVHAQTPVGGLCEDAAGTGLAMTPQDAGPLGLLPGRSLPLIAATINWLSISLQAKKSGRQK